MTFFLCVTLGPQCRSMNYFLIDLYTLVLISHNFLWRISGIGYITCIIKRLNGLNLFSWFFFLAMASLSPTLNKFQINTNTYAACVCVQHFNNGLNLLVYQVENCLHSRFLIFFGLRFHKKISRKKKTCFFFWYLFYFTFNL